MLTLYCSRPFRDFYSTKTSRIVVRVRHTLTAAERGNEAIRMTLAFVLPAAAHDYSRFIMC